MDEAVVREEKISRRLEESKEMIDKAKEMLGERWGQQVEEEALLAKISLLREAVREGDEKDGKEREKQVEKRIKFEENAKRMLYEASKTKVDAEMRAFRAEEKLKQKELGQVAKVEEASCQTEPDSELTQTKDSSKLSRMSEMVERMEALNASVREVAVSSSRLDRLESTVRRLVACHRRNNAAVVALAVAMVAVILFRVLEVGSRRAVVPIAVW